MAEPNSEKWQFSFGLYFLYWTKYIPQLCINETWIRICICRCTERIWNVWIYPAIKWRISDMKCFCCLLYVWIFESPYLLYIYRPHLYPIFYFGNRMFAIKFITFQVNKKIILTNYFRKSLCTCVLHKCRKTLLKVFLCNNPWSVFFDIKNFFSQELHFSFLYFVIRKVCRSEYNVRYRISSCLFNEIYDIVFIILPFTFFGTLQPRVDKLTWELDLFAIQLFLW